MAASNICCSDGVNQRHIPGSSRCPAGQQLGGFRRAWLLFWKSSLSPARLDEERGLAVFGKLQKFLTQDPLGEAVCTPMGAGGRPGDAEEPSPPKLVPNGAVPHGHIPLSQPKPEDTATPELGLCVPHCHQDFLSNLTLTSSGLSHRSEHLPSKEAHMSFFLHPTSKCHALGIQRLAGLSWSVCLAGGGC